MRIRLRHFLILSFFVGAFVVPLGWDQYEAWQEQQAFTKRLIEALSKRLNPSSATQIPTRPYGPDQKELKSQEKVRFGMRKALRLFNMKMWMLPRTEM